MKLRSCLLPIGLLLLAGAGGWWALRPGAPTVNWRTEPVVRGDVRETVAATGTLDAVLTVEVGTQVSGVIEALEVDYNDAVTAGQIIARIDTSILEADVASARANLAVREAELARARQVDQREAALSQGGATSAEAVEEATTSLAVAEAQVKVARVSLDRATRNLRYATITAPIDGTVVERDVDVGQTVNAGLSAPRLFLIAGDLSHMQILAAVDESDIGRIQEGQAVEFTVQAFPDETFRGAVRQVRLQSAVTENVVTYTAVVDVDNADGRLLPGMTATVDFITRQAALVLCVPGAALRFKPDEAAIVGGSEAAPEGKRGRKGGAAARLWLATDPTHVRALPVKKGIVDSHCVEVEGEGLTEGLEVVVGQQQPDADEQSGGANPWQQKQAGGRRGPGGF